MFDRILVVCTGNICRSPIGEAMLARQFPSRKVQSAGIGALIGHAADPLAIEVAAQTGLELSEHRARQITEVMLRDADLVLVMDRTHSDWLNRRYPQHRGRVHKWLRWQGDRDVVDPYGQPRSIFESVLSDIEIGAGDWIGRIG